MSSRTVGSGTGPMHPQVAEAVNELGSLAFAQDQNELAEAHDRRVLSFYRAARRDLAAGSDSLHQPELSARFHAELGDSAVKPVASPARP